jgi:hypothetical protein
MQTIEVPSDRFDVEGFVDATRRFYRAPAGACSSRNESPSDGEDSDDFHGYLAVYDEEGEGDGLSWPGIDIEYEDPRLLLARGETLLFAFHDFCNYSGPLRFVDGQVIDIPDETVTEGDPYWEQLCEWIPSEYDGYGFLLTVKDETARIETVKYLFGWPNTSPATLREHDCGLFDWAMEKFARKFLIE